MTDTKQNSVETELLHICSGVYAGPHNATSGWVTLTKIIKSFNIKFKKSLIVIKSRLVGHVLILPMADNISNQLN